MEIPKKEGGIFFFRQAAVPVLWDMIIIFIYYTILYIHVGILLLNINLKIKPKRIL